MAAIPSSRHSSAARPVTWISGFPRGLGSTPTSRQRMPPCPQPHAQGLGKGLLGRETLGELVEPLLRPGVAIGDFPAGEDSLQKSLAVAANHPGQAVHLDQVHADAVDHE